MYVPKHFEQKNSDELYQLITAYPLATIIINNASGLEANHIPLLLTQMADAGTVCLQGHIARSNNLLAYDGVEILAIFHGPQAYISPNWYPGKKQHGKAVPTWNYAVVHARGILRILDDPLWLKQHLAKLTSQHEANLENPWHIADAPADFIDQLIKAVVGIEIEIKSLTGKWKLSQNQPLQNQSGVIDGLKDQARNHEIIQLTERACNLSGEESK